MKRISHLLFIACLALVLGAADGCSSDPNVEGAKLDLRNKDYDRAMSNIEKALETNPDNATALKLKGDIYMAQLEDANDPAMRTEMTRELVTAYQRAAQLDPELQAEVSMELQRAYVGAYGKGIAKYNAAQEAGDPALFGEAAMAFSDATIIAPDTATIYVNQGFALVQANRPVEAIPVLEMAIEKGDMDSNTFIYLSSLYSENGRQNDAVSLLERATGMMPDDEAIRQQLLTTYIAAGQMDRAMDFYSTAVERDPNNATYRYNYGSLLLEAERYDESIVQLEAAVSLDEMNPNGYYNLGAAFINQAVNVNDQVRLADDALREQRGDLSRDEVATREASIDQLVNQRKSLFERAIVPLERARELSRMNGESEEESCRALFQAYTNVGQTEKAQAISDCAGYGDVN